MLNLCDLRTLRVDLVVATGRLFIHLHDGLVRDRGEQACLVMGVVVAIVIVSALAPAR